MEKKCPRVIPNKEDVAGSNPNNAYGLYGNHIKVSISGSTSDVLLPL